MNLIKAIENHVEGSDVSGVKQGLQEMKVVLQSVATQNASGVELENMKELDGNENRQATLLAWQKAYVDGEKIMDAEKQSADEADKKVTQDINAGLVPHLQNAKKETSKVHVPLYSNYRQNWTMEDLVSFVQDSDDYGVWHAQASMLGGKPDSMSVNIPMDMVKQAVEYALPLEPSDRVVSEASRPRPILDMVRMVSNPRSHITFSPIVTSVSEQSGAANKPGSREFGAESNEANFEGGRESVQKRALSAHTFIDHELGVASPDSVVRAVDSLTLAVMELISSQILNGDNSGQNWNGILRQLTGTGFTEAVPGTSPGSMFSYMESSVGLLEDRGYRPNAIIARRNDRNKAKATLVGRNANYGEFTATGGPAPEGVPVIVTPDVGVNTVLVGAFDPATVEVETMMDMQIVIDESYRVTRSQTTVVANIVGNVALYERRGFYKLTTTNNAT